MFPKIKLNQKIIDGNTGKIYSSEINNIQQKINSKIKFIKNKLCLHIMENKVENIIFYYSFFNHKIPQILVDPKNKDLIKYIIDNFKPNIIICNQSNKSFLKKFKTIHRIKETLLLTNHINYKPLIHKELTLLIPTSGSTGKNKLVMLSRKNILINSNDIIKNLNIKKNQIPILDLPIFYSYGLSVLNTHLLVGCDIVITDKSIFQKEYWEIIKKYKITSFSGVPLTYDYLFSSKLYKKFNNKVKYFTQAGGKLNKDIISKIIQKFKNKKFFIMYGFTEASPRVSILNYKEFKTNSQSCGKLIGSGKIEFIKRKNEKIGQIKYSGKNLMMGYAKNFKDLNPSKNIQLKSFLTQDYGYMKNNFLYITGRSNSHAKIAGFRIDLNSLNEIIKKSAYCLADDDVIYVFYQGKEISKNDKKLLFKNTKLNHSFFKFIKKKEFPKLSNGKIDLKILYKEVNDKKKNTINFLTK